MKVKVELNIQIHGETTFEEAVEYLKFELGYNGDCRAENPFISGDAEFKVVDFDCEEE